MSLLSKYLHQYLLKKILILFSVSLLGLLMIKCSEKVYFNPVINGIEYNENEWLKMDQIKFKISKLCITNYTYLPELNIKFLNESEDTLFCFPSQVVLYKNDELFLNEFKKDSLNIILPGEQKEIYFYSDTLLFDDVYDSQSYVKGIKKSKPIKLGLLITTFKVGRKNIEFPLIRFLPEKGKDFPFYKFLIE